MDSEKIEQYVNSILWGKKIVEVNNKFYVFRSLTIAEKNYAQFVLDRSIDKYKKYGLKSKDELICIAKKNNIWNDVDENYFFKFDELVQVAKDQIQNASFVTKRRIEQQIEQAKKKREEVIEKYNEITYNSIEQQSSEDRIKYIIMKTLETIDGELYWTDDKEFKDSEEYIFLSKAIQAYINLISGDIDISFIRKVARSNSWRIRWNGCKGNIVSIFNTEVGNLNDEQLLLIYWTLYYDSIYNSIDCPPDDVIEDDEKIDKWYENHSKEEDRKRRDHYLDKKINKGFYDSSGKYRQHGRGTENHKEVGYMIDGYYDEDGIFRYYTEEERRRLVERIYGKNSSEVRQRLIMESKKTKGKNMRDEQLRKGQARRFFSEFKR